MKLSLFLLIMLCSCSPNYCQDDFDDAEPTLIGDYADGTECIYGHRIEKDSLEVEISKEDYFDICRLEKMAHEFNDHCKNGHCHFDLKLDSFVCGDIKDPRSCSWNESTVGYGKAITWKKITTYGIMTLGFIIVSLASVGGILYYILQEESNHSKKQI